MKSKRYDPLRYLPYEIWVQCMQIYTHEQPQGPLPLLSLSPNWRLKLLEEPSLWTTIYFDGGHDERCRVECFFHLSDNLSVTVVLDRDSCAIETVVRYRDRIKSLIFGTQSIHRYSSRHIVAVSQALVGYVYPNLAHIHVQPPHFAGVLVPRTLIEACPALVGIHGAYVLQEMISSLPPSTVKVGISGNGLLAKDISDQLETLRIFCSTTEPDNFRYQNYFTGPTTRLNSFALDFGELSHTLRNGRPIPIAERSHLLPIQAFSSTSHYGLASLRLTMPWYEVANLTHCLSACRSLRQLELTLDCSSIACQPWDVPPLTLDDLGQVRKLFIHMKPVKASMVQENLALIIRLFAEKEALQDLEELRLALPDRDTKPEILDLLRSTKNLKELYWIGTKAPGAGQNLEKVLLTRLHTLVVQYGSDLRYIRAPNLIRLECHVDLPRIGGYERISHHLPGSWVGTLESITVPTFSIYRWNDLLVKENTNENRFSRVLLLEFTRGPFDYQPMVLPVFLNLRSVSFDDRANHTAVGFMKESTGDSVLNHFMLEMIISPDTCPLLHTIKSTLYPNWALAVAFFHRRNSLGGVTPINSFWLHGRPQPYILGLLLGALKPSGEDLVSDIVLATAVDEVLHGRWKDALTRKNACQDCIMSGYVSCPNSTLTNASLEDRTIKELWDLDLSDGGMRKPIRYSRDIWVAHLKKTIITVGEPDTPRCCKRHRRNEVHIGPHSADDLPTLGSELALAPPPPGI